MAFQALEDAVTASLRQKADEAVAVAIAAAGAPVTAAQVQQMQQQMQQQLMQQMQQMQQQTMQQMQQMQQQTNQQMQLIREDVSAWSNMMAKISNRSAPKTATIVYPRVGGAIPPNVVATYDDLQGLRAGGDGCQDRNERVQALLNFYGIADPANGAPFEGDLPAGQPGNALLIQKVNALWFFLSTP